MSAKYLRCLVNILLYAVGIVMLFFLTPRLLVDRKSTRLNSSHP